MKTLSKDQCVANFSANNPPALTVAQGEPFRLETASILTRPEDFPDKTTIPVTGPVYIKGAKPGTTLRIEIVTIELTAGEGAIVAKPGKGAFGDRIYESTYKVVTYDEKYAYFNNSIKVPLRPMVGKVGVAPLGSPVDSHAPGSHGGNMDITDIKQGSSVYLPVFVEGALLACGDVHAVMGDGESEFSALETEARLTLRCQILDGMNLKNPLLITDSEMMTVGHGENLEEACKIALDDMVTILLSKLKIEFVDAAMLISIAADLKINQIVNSFVGARAAIPLSIFPRGSFI